MPQHDLRKVPATIVQHPWLALCILLLFGAGVLIFEQRNLKSESAFITKLVTEKGNAFITIIENALRTEPELHWSDNSLRTLMANLGADKDLHLLALVDAEGKVLLGTGEGAQLIHLWDVPPPDALTGTAVSVRGRGHFRVSRRIQVNQGSATTIPHGGIHGSPHFSQADAPLWVVADYSMQPISSAREADRLHLWIIAVILLLLVFLWSVSWYLARKHWRAR